MENKIYIMNEKRYKQIEIECSRMAQGKTVFFLVPEAEETKYTLYLENCLYSCDFTIAETKEDARQLWEDGDRSFLVLSSDGSDRYADCFETWEEIEHSFLDALFGLERIE